MSNVNGAQEHSAESTGIVVSRDATLDSYRRGLEPTTLGDAYKFAEVVASTGLCGLKSAAEALTRIMYGRELGFTTMQSISAVYTIDGKPALYAADMETLVRASGACALWEFVEDTDTVCVLRAQRRDGKEKEVRWTVEDAIEVGLYDKTKPASAWFRWTRRMLIARCRSDMANMLFPDVMRGMKSREELEDERGEVVKIDVHATQVDEKAIASVGAAFEARAKALIEKIGAAKSKPEWATVRAEIEQVTASGELSGAYLDSVKAAYNARVEEAKKAKAAASPPTTPTPQVTPAPAPAAAPTPPASEAPRMREPGEEG